MQAIATHIACNTTTTTYIFRIVAHAFFIAIKLSKMEHRIPKMGYEQRHCIVFVPVSVSAQNTSHTAPHCSARRSAPRSERTNFSNWAMSLTHIWLPWHRLYSIHQAIAVFWGHSIATSCSLNNLTINSAITRDWIIWPEQLFFVSSSSSFFCMFCGSNFFSLTIRPARQDNNDGVDKRKPWQDTTNKTDCCPISNIIPGAQYNEANMFWLSSIKYESNSELKSQYSKLERYSTEYSMTNCLAQFVCGSGVQLLNVCVFVQRLRLPFFWLDHFFSRLLQLIAKFNNNY